jgi:hydroxymethylbilane synthase
LRTLRIGTRGSRLALVQCGLVAALLESAGVDVELVSITTSGDVRPPDTAPGEGVFVAAIAQALAAGHIDVGVHSAKDVPVDEPAELPIVAYPLRADARDALVLRREEHRLAAGASVGTDSPRRRGFLLAGRGDLEVRPLHGNVDTRLRRLDAGEVDALVLAAAGLDRLGLGERASVRFEAVEMPPAPAQGALAIQARATDRSAIELLKALDRPDIRLAVTAERAVLAGAGGGCRAPVGALAEVRKNRLRLVAGAVDPDGGNRRILELDLPLEMEAARQAALEAGRRLRTTVQASAHEGGA